MREKDSSRNPIHGMDFGKRLTFSHVRMRLRRMLKTATATNTPSKSIFEVPDCPRSAQPSKLQFNYLDEQGWLRCDMSIDKAGFSSYHMLYQRISLELCGSCIRTITTYVTSMLHADFKRHHPKGQTMEWADYCKSSLPPEYTPIVVVGPNETRITFWEMICLIKCPKKTQLFHSVKSKPSDLSLRTPPADPYRGRITSTH